jgi:PKD repeat protein
MLILPLVLATTLCIAGQAAAQSTDPEPPPGGNDRQLTPLIGVNPTSLSFGPCNLVGECFDLSIDLFNDVGDSTSVLEVTGLSITGADFFLNDPPALPLEIPGDGTVVPVGIRFCPTDTGPRTATLTIEAPDALNHPLVVDLEGEGNFAPECDAGGPYEGLVGEEIAFDATASVDPDGVIDSYDWDFGDGQVGSGAMPTHSYAAIGTYTVMLTVVDDCGAETTCETTAEIDEEPGMSPVIGVDPSSLDFGDCILIGECEQLTINVFNDVNDPLNILEVTELNISGDGFSLVDPPALPLQIPGDGSVVMLTVELCAQASGLHEGTLTVVAPLATNTPVDVPLSGEGNAPPVCDANGPYAGNVGELINFDGSGSYDPDGVIVSYDWDFGDGSTGTGEFTTHAYTAVGDYTVTLVVTDLCDATSTCESTVEISQPTPVELSFFDAMQEGAEVVVSWRTRFEADNLGFRVYRGEAGEEPVRISDLIASKGSSGDYVYVDRNVEVGESYNYYLADVDLTGAEVKHGPRRVTLVQSAPARLALQPNRPNPFNPSTWIRFELPAADHVSLVIYDATGRPVRTIADRVFDSGAHALEWNGRDDAGRSMASGVYFMQLRAGERTLTRKMVMAR